MFTYQYIIEARSGTISTKTDSWGNKQDNISNTEVGVQVSSQIISVQFSMRKTQVATEAMSDNVGETWLVIWKLNGSAF